jgi:hypothetical protein
MVLSMVFDALRRSERLVLEPERNLWGVGVGCPAETFAFPIPLMKSTCNRSSPRFTVAYVGVLRWLLEGVLLPRSEKECLRNVTGTSCTHVFPIGRHFPRRDPLILFLRSFCIPVFNLCTPWQMAPSHIELFSLESRTTLCTGVTRGIEAQVAIALAEAGADILLVQV